MPRMRVLGKTGTEVSEIGLGGIPLMQIDFDKAAEVINRALDRGINYFDTARAYGDSEAKFGQVVCRRRDECFVATKTVARTSQDAVADLRASVSALKTNCLDLWQLHDVSTEETWDQVMAPGGAREAARRAKDRGMVRFVGLSSHNVNVLEAAVESGEFDVLLLVYNLAINDTADVMRKAAQAGIGVAVMKPLSGGIFFNHLKDENSEIEITPRIAWRYVLSNEDLSVACAGAKTVRDIEQAVRASNAFEPLSAEEAAPYVEHAQSLGEAVCSDCRYCQDCPEGIEVYSVMKLMDRHQAFPYEWPKHRIAYDQLETKTDVCTQCGACEERCPLNLPITEQLAKAHQALSQPV